MKFKILFLLLPLSLLCTSLSGRATDTTQVLDRLKATAAMLESNVDSSRAMIFENIADSKKIGFDKGTAKAYLQLIQYYYLKGTADSAMAYFPDLEKAGKGAKDQNLGISILLKIALVYSDIGDFKHALEKAVEAQKLADGSTNYRLVAKVYHDLGLLYSNKSIYKNAF